MRNKVKSDEKHRKYNQLKIEPGIILRVKTIIAYNKGWSIATVAECYDVHEKTLKNWRKNF
jgi:transposase-like protein